jgi:hypothetical protein
VGLGSESSTRHFRLTRHMSLYTLHSKAVTADCIAPGYGRSSDSQLQRRRYTSCVLDRPHLPDVLIEGQYDLQTLSDPAFVSHLARDLDVHLPA